MSKAFKILEMIQHRIGRDRESWIDGKRTKTLSPTPNDYYTDKLPIIPAGTDIQLNFGGDFGIYGIADIQGVLHKIKVELHDLHFIDWSELLEQYDAL